MSYVFFLLFKQSAIQNENRRMGSLNALDQAFRWDFEPFSMDFNLSIFFGHNLFVSPFLVLAFFLVLSLSLAIFLFFFNLEFFFTISIFCCFFFKFTFVSILSLSTKFLKHYSLSYSLSSNVPFSPKKYKNYDFASYSIDFFQHLNRLLKRPFINNPIHKMQFFFITFSIAITLVHFPSVRIFLTVVPNPKTKATKATDKHVFILVIGL